MKNLIIQPLKTGANENWERREMEEVEREKVKGEKEERWRKLKERKKRDGGS